MRAGDVSMKRLFWIPTLLLSLGAPHSAGAQTVSEVVTFLMTNQAVRTSDFERDRLAAETARDTITQSLLVNLTSVPLTTSSSGFLYRFNPQLGTPERATQTFGGFFLERALTAGAGRVSIGFSTATAAFNRLDGKNLRDGTLVTIANQFRDEPAPFDEELLTLRIRSVTTTLYASVGVGSRLEFGAAVPIVRVTLDGARVNIYRGTAFPQAAGSSTASGVGDVALRAKAQLVSVPGGGVSVATELRLPSGDEKNLFGAGSTALKILGIGSLERGPLALHVNGGVLQGGVSNEWTIAGGASAAIGSRVTIVGEVLGRRLSDLREIELISAPHPTFSGVDTLRLSAGPAGRQLLDALGGAKWNVANRMVLNAHVRWSVLAHGLTAPLTPTIGFEYSF
jgi:hypothetical protein